MIWSKLWDVEFGVMVQVSAVNGRVNPAPYKTVEDTVWTSPGRGAVHEDFHTIKKSYHLVSHACDTNLSFLNLNFIRL